MRQKSAVKKMIITRIIIVLSLLATIQLRAEQKLQPTVTTKEISKKKNTSPMTARRPNDENVFNINTTPDYPITDEFNDPVYQVNKPTEYEEPYLNPAKSFILLKKTGLDKYTSGWDQLEKDLLIIRAGSYDLKVLIKKYPRIPIDKLVNLKSELQQVQ